MSKLTVAGKRFLGDKPIFPHGFGWIAVPGMRLAIRLAAERELEEARKRAERR